MGYTRNWDNYSAMLLCGDSDTGETGYVDGSLQMKNVSGTVATSTLALAMGSADYHTSGVRTLGHMSSTATISTASIGASATMGARLFLIAGSGTGAENYDDYAITDFSGQTHVSYSYGINPVYNAETDKWTYTITRILANNSGATITVGEIAVIFALGNTATFNYLVYRKKLDTPFEVPNGSNYSISLDFEYQAQSH